MVEGARLSVITRKGNEGSNPSLRHFFIFLRFTQARTDVDGWEN